MAITYPLNFPNIGNDTVIEKMTVRLVSSVAVQESPFTYKQQVQDFGGMRWEAEIKLRPMTYTESLLYQAFFTKLNGTKGTFSLGNPLAISSDSGGDISINGSSADAGDNEIAITVASGHSITSGQMFSVNANSRDYLHMFLDNATAGNSTVDIRPPLRVDLSDNQAIQTDLPRGTWRLATSQIEWDIDKAGIYGFTFSCVEAL